MFAHGGLKIILFVNFAQTRGWTRWKHAHLSYNKCRHNGIIWIRRANLNFQARRYARAGAYLGVRICFIIRDIKVTVAHLHSLTRVLPLPAIFGRNKEQRHDERREIDENVLSVRALPIVIV